MHLRNYSIERYAVYSPIPGNVKHGILDTTKTCKRIIEEALWCWETMGPNPPNQQFGTIKFKWKGEEWTLWGVKNSHGSNWSIMMEKPNGAVERLGSDDVVRLRDPSKEFDISTWLRVLKLLYKARIRKHAWDAKVANVYRDALRTINAAGSAYHLIPTSKQGEIIERGLARLSGAERKEIMDSVWGSQLAFIQGRTTEGLDSLQRQVIVKIAEKIRKKDPGYV